ncbi:toprim domain-containing protein [bacterium]|nr:toprim domain-containing protein [bacterium]
MTGPVIGLVSAYVGGLRPSGDGNYIGFCPIHGEVAGRSNPSFSIHSETGLWICFAGCGAGNLEQFLRRVKLPPEEIARAIAAIGPLVPKAKPPIQWDHDPFRAQYPLREAILGVWQIAPEHLIAEGFNEEVLFDHDIGVDLENERITFPIRDLYGTFAGVSGRDISGRTDRMRYKVYREELRRAGYTDYEFNSRNLLWRADRVYAKLVGRKDALVARAAMNIIVVEGYKACLWLVQHGYPDTMALQGSRITENQRRLLFRMGGQILVMLDNDRAGAEGTQVMCQKLAGLSVVPVLYPREYHQPSDIPSRDLHNILKPYVR